MLADFLEWVSKQAEGTFGASTWERAVAAKHFDVSVKTIGRWADQACELGLMARIGNGWQCCRTASSYVLLYFDASYESVMVAFEDSAVWAAMKVAKAKKAIVERQQIAKLKAERDRFEASMTPEELAEWRSQPDLPWFTKGHLCPE